MKRKYLPFRVKPEKGAIKTAHVYGPGVRVWHWLNAFATIILIVTGYFIGTPPASSIGDTSSMYTMGWIRFFHLSSGYIFALLCITRIWLMSHEKGISHHLFFPAIWRQEWDDAFVRQIKWNFLVAPAQRYEGLNPLAGIAMLFMFVIPAFIVFVTGFAMYAEVAGHDSWQYFCFGWVTSIFGNTLDLHIIHRLSMWVIAWFVATHIYIAIREDILSRQTVISTMFSGERQYRD